MKQGEPFNVLRDRNSWSNAPRAEAIVAVVLPSLTAGTFAYAAAVTVTSFALSVATSAIISALTPTPPSPKQSLLVNARDAAAPQEIVYGETRKGGTITYLETTRGGSVLYQIIALAAHEIESVEEIYINDEVAVLSDDGYTNSRGRTGAGWVTNRNWSDDPDEHEIRIFYHLGDQTSITDTFANSSSESLDSVFFNTGSSDEDSQNFGGVDQPTKASFVGNGVAYIFVRYSYASSVFSNGIPTITARIRGKKVYDPRTTATAYSNNAALCIRDYLTSDVGLNDSEVDETVFQVAANTCDESVSLDGGGTEKRYTINGVVRADQTYGDVLQEMTTACAGTLFWGAGKWKLQAGDYNAPTKTFTLDDLRSEISLQTRVNLRDQFNRVQGTFVDANQRYITADYPPIISEGTGSFTEQDGGVPQPLNLDLPFTTSAATAQRLAKMTLFRGREQMTFSAEFGLSAFDVEVGDIVALDMDRYGWIGKEFEVVGWRFGANDEAGDLRIPLTLRETSEAAFDWNAEESDIIGNDSGLPGYNNNLTITDLTAIAGGRTQGDGTFINSVILSWTAPDNDYIARYDVQWKPTADTEFASTTTTEETIEISPVVDGVEYTFQVRAVSTFGNLGPFTSITFTAGGDDTIPNAPTSVIATGYFQSAVISWTPPTTNTDGSAFNDLRQYNIYRSLSNNFASAVVVGSSQSPSFKDVGLDDNTLYYYWVTAQDFSGNESAPSTPNDATTNFISAAQMVADIREEIGAARIDVVSSLPSGAGYNAGDFVFLTSDKKLYEWNGSSWVAAVGDIPSGSITSTQIANDAITTPKLATNSVTTDALAADSVTADKLTTNSVIAGKIAAGAVSADKIAVTNLAAIEANLGEVTAGSINTLTSGIGVQINVAGKPNSTYIYNNQGGNYALYAEHTNANSGATEIKSNGGWTILATNRRDGQNTGFLPHMVMNANHTASGGGHANIAVSATGGGYGVDVKSGGYYASSGTYQPFTGAHEGALLKTSMADVGDIMVDKRALSVSINDSFTELERSSSPNQKAAVGVLNCMCGSLNWDIPAAFYDCEATQANMDTYRETGDPADLPAPVTKNNPEQYEADYHKVTINSLGEGAINVCGENGDLEVGDLIVTSSTPGKGMKQSDDIVRNYTVAKVRENVTFSDPTEVKMVACIYLCG